MTVAGRVAADAVTGMTVRPYARAVVAKTKNLGMAKILSNGKAAGRVLEHLTPGKSWR